MYAASKNVSAFETIAGELYTTLGAEDPTWAKVAEIGIKLEPNNPLYQANSTPTGSTDKFVDTEKKLDATDFTNSPLAAEKDLDFSFDNDALTQDFASTGVAAESEITKPDFGVAEPFAHTGVADSMANENVKTSNISDSGAMDFDMGDLGAFETATPAEEPIKVASEAFGHTMPGLDIPTFAAPNFMPEAEPELGKATSEHIDDFSTRGEVETETFEFPQAETDEAVLDIGSKQTQVTEAEVDNEGDFSFNVNTIQPDAASYKDADFTDANTYDLSTISLDLNDGAETGTTTASHDDLANEKTIESEHESAQVVGEPIEVETKLELVVAYIEMDDKEGAKELLDEVIKEGGKKQRKRAEELLAKLA